MTDLLAIYETPFMRDALALGCIAGALLAYLGLFVILRRQVLLGVALPQFAAFGVGAAMAVGAPPLAGALGGVFLGSTVVSIERKSLGLGRETTTGLALALSSAGLLIVLAACAPDTHGVDLLTGDILGATAGEVMMLGIVASIIALLHAITWKEIVLVSYDRETAATLGLNVTAWDALLVGTVGAGVAASLKTSGAVFSLAALLGPSTAAIIVARRMRTAVFLATMLGAACSALGLTLSFLYELPSGPTMAASMILPVIPAIAWKRFYPGLARYVWRKTPGGGNNPPPG